VVAISVENSTHMTLVFRQVCRHARIAGSKAP
jgi:hypothetical protein